MGTCSLPAKKCLSKVKLSLLVEASLLLHTMTAGKFILDLAEAAADPIKGASTAVLRPHG